MTRLGEVVLEAADGLRPFGDPGWVAPCATFKDMNNLAVTLRIHKDFLP